SADARAVSNGGILPHPFFFQAEDGIRDFHVTGVQTCALPIYATMRVRRGSAARRAQKMPLTARLSLSVPPPVKITSEGRAPRARSEEHTSELQSRENLVCRLLLEKKKSTNEKESA